MLRVKYIVLIFLQSFFLLSSCSKSDNSLIPKEVIEEDNRIHAFVLDIKVSGSNSNYNFSVTLSSPDLGCNQYADWWEILDSRGELLYRRVLSHSHVNEQPFTRSGGPVEIYKDDHIYIRGHMNNGGYGRQAMSGSIQGGFKKIVFLEDFKLNLAFQDPQPPKCAF